MATTPSLFLLLLSLPLLFTATVCGGDEPYDHRHSHIHHYRRSKIMDALIGSGDFGNWAGILSNPDSSGLHISATLFIPSNNNNAAAATDVTSSAAAFAAANLSLVPYHIVPQRLTFSNLLLLKINDRIPTLSPNNTILITNNSRSNFTINDSPITYPDLYTTSGIVVHGIGKILDYSVYGHEMPALAPNATVTANGSPVEEVPPKNLPVQIPLRTFPGDMKSKGASLRSEVRAFFWVVRGVLALKICGALFL